MFNSPILELLGNGDPRKTLIDLIFHFLSGHTSLRTQWPSAFRAMVIGVMEKQRVCHFLNRRSATRAGITVSVGKFEFAIAAHDLMPLIGCHHPGTLAAVDEAGESKFVMRLWTRFSFSAKQRLHPVIFRLGDHRLVLSLIPLAASCGIFNPTVIERLGESLVDGASAEWFAAHAPSWSCAKTPFLIGDFKDFWRSVETGQHQVPH